MAYTVVCAALIDTVHSPASAVLTPAHYGTAIRVTGTVGSKCAAEFTVGNKNITTVGMANESAHIFIFSSDIGVHRYSLNGDG